MYYPIVIHHEEGSCYGVIVPDLPGCYSAGEDLEDAIEQTKEAIDLHLEMLVEDGEDLPLPQNLSIHQKNSDYEGGTWALVEIDETRYLGKPQRLNISLPTSLVTRIDRTVKNDTHYKDRSNFLAEAALKALASA